MSGHYEPHVTPFGHDADGIERFVSTTVVCHVCGDPATERPIYSGTATGNNHDLFDRQYSSQTTVVAYACTEHFEEVMNGLAVIYRWCSVTGPLEPEPRFIPDKSPE